MEEDAYAFARETHQSVEVGRRYLKANVNDLQEALAAFRSDMSAFSSNTPSSSSSSMKKGPNVSSGPRVASLRDLSDDSRDNGGNNYYTGGKESGLAVLGGDNDNKKGRQQAMLEAFMNAMKSQGVNPEQYKKEEEEKASTSHAFGGLGHTLGETKDDSLIVGTSMRLTNQSSDQSFGPKKLLLELWKDGYSVDDGETQPQLVEYDPSGQFIASLTRSQVPRELGEKYGYRIDLEVMDRREEAFTPRKMTMKAFIGQGNRLGNVLPSSSTPSQQHHQQKEKPQQTTSPAVVKLDETKPKTRIQFRLADGTRLVAQFNTTATLSDLYSFVRLSRTQQPAFTLLQYPRTKFAECSTTLEEAKLLNSVVLQKYD
eukprot:m.25532 g.25532  ORF g.25532 m.25532 type:complete len:371 (-) comp5774_c0_seq2:567-1679(-)